VLAAQEIGKGVWMSECRIVEMANISRQKSLYLCQGKVEISYPPKMKVLSN
jgi:hypothetical protein